IICHQLNTKNNIISGSEVSRLSVAIQSPLKAYVVPSAVMVLTAANFPFLYNLVTALVRPILVYSTIEFTVSNKISSKRLSMLTP
ncbi:hypothetical protein NL404_24780, partial [Klebsiella pneumoniae]|nr:hypothetical protein [Klebsiella pneumoniae]